MHRRVVRILTGSKLKLKTTSFRIEGVCKRGNVHQNSILHHKSVNLGLPTPSKGCGWKIVLHVYRAVSIMIYTFIVTFADRVNATRKNGGGSSSQWGSPGCCNRIPQLLLSKGQHFYILDLHVQLATVYFVCKGWHEIISVFLYPIGQESTLSRVEFDPSASKRHVTLWTGIKFSCHSLVSNLRHPHSKAAQT